jgi:hypothetical protein
MQFVRDARIGMLAAVLAFAAACDDTTTEPTRASLAGTYVATTFTSTTNGVVTNHLQSGGMVTLTLTSAGTTTGQILVPNETDDNLAGTWDIVDDDEIDLDHDADTFIRDMELRVVGNTLVGDRTFGGTRIQLVLTRQ